MSTEQQTTKKKAKLPRILLGLILLALAFFALQFIVRTYFVEVYAIPSGSMEQSIMTGDKVFAEQISYYFRDVEEGDIITFEDPEDPEKTLIKRCIATAGQTIDLREGVVYVNELPISEPYIEGAPSNPPVNPPDDVTYPYTVPEGHVWVMGDNRTNSQDSRYFGSIETEDVYERAFMVYWPIDRVGLLD